MTNSEPITAVQERVRQRWPGHAGRPYSIAGLMRDAAWLSDEVDKLRVFRDAMVRDYFEYDGDDDEQQCPYCLWLPGRGSEHDCHIHAAWLAMEAAGQDD